MSTSPRPYDEILADLLLKIVDEHGRIYKSEGARLDAIRDLVMAANAERYARRKLGQAKGRANAAR